MGEINKNCLVVMGFDSKSKRPDDFIFYDKNGEKVYCGPRGVSQRKIIKFICEIKNNIIGQFDIINLKLNRHLNCIVNRLTMRIFSVVIVVLLPLICLAQKATVTWGEEFKLKKGSSDLEVIHADKTGVYLKESHYVNVYFVPGASPREVSSLIKLNNNLEQQYNTDFGKELRGKDYEGFFFIKNILYLLASDESDHGKTLTLYAAAVDKSNGKLAGEWIELTELTKEDKNEAITFKADYNADSSKMVLVSTVAGSESNRYEVRLFDENMKSAGKPIFITNEFEPYLYTLENVVYTSANTVVLAGREYEYQEGEKTKKKNRDFKNYSIRVYNNSGTIIKQINTDINGKWLISTKLEQIHSGNIVMAAFYANQKKGSETNGMLVQRIDPATGEVLSTSNKSLSTGMITAQQSGKSGTENEGTGFSKFMEFRNFIETEDGGLVIIGEKFFPFEYTTSYYSPSTNGSGGTMQYSNYMVYDCGEIMMSKIESSTGDIKWLYVVPKNQDERIYLSSSSGGGTSVNYNYYFKGGSNWPFYAGIGIMQNKETVSILFNDNPVNGDLLAPTRGADKCNDFAKSGCYAIKLNTLTGKYTRTLLFSNEEQPAAMPRLSSYIGNEVYLTGKLDRRIGKSKITVGRLILK